MTSVEANSAAGWREHPDFSTFSDSRLDLHQKLIDEDIRWAEKAGSHISGDAVTLTDTLNQILKEDLDRIWKQACASARAKPFKPLVAEQSDDLRRRFAPIVRARSVAVQRFIDPDNSRRL